MREREGRRKRTKTRGPDMEDGVEGRSDQVQTKMREDEGKKEKWGRGGRLFVFIIRYNQVERQRF